MPRIDIPTEMIEEARHAITIALPGKMTENVSRSSKGWAETLTMTGVVKTALEDFINIKKSAEEIGNRGSALSGIKKAQKELKEQQAEIKEILREIKEMKS